MVQQIFTCSNSTVETVEKGVKYIQSNNKDLTERRQWRCSDVFIVNLFHISRVSVLDSLQVHIYWVTQNFSINFSCRRFTLNSAGIYLLWVSNRNTRTRCETCSELTIKTPEWRQWHRFNAFIVNFEHISHLFLVFLLLTLNM